MALVMEGDYEDAYAFGQLVATIAQRFPNPARESTVLTGLGGHVFPWRVRLLQWLADLRRAHILGLPSGNLVFAAHSIYAHLFAFLFRGTELDSSSRRATPSSRSTSELETPPA